MGEERVGAGPLASGAVTRRYQLAPSILSADFARLGEEVQRIESYADFLHVDTMDGHFVPPISLGPVIAESLRKVTSLKLDHHLMVTDPHRHAEQFAEVGGGGICFHLEAARDPMPVIQRCRELGLTAGLTINLETPVEATLPYLEHIDSLTLMSIVPGWSGQPFDPIVLEKVTQARKQLDAAGLEADIVVDGGINPQTGRQVLDAGANVLVAASAIFRQPDPAAAAGALRDLLDTFGGSSPDPGT